MPSQCGFDKYPNSCRSSASGQIFRAKFSSACMPSLSWTPTGPSEAGIWFNTLRQSERCTKRGRSLKALCPASLNLMQVQLGRTSADDGLKNEGSSHMFTQDSRMQRMWWLLRTKCCRCCSQPTSELRLEVKTQSGLETDQRCIC